MFNTEAFEASLAVIRALEKWKIDYLVGGSLASSYHGMPRATNDADLIADLKLAHVPLLATELRGRFYHDEDRMRDAVRRRSSFNVIFLKTMFKVDVFVLKDDPLSRLEMRRRQRVVLDEASGEAFDVASAEDTVLQKLAWYREGGETSDRQWHDLLGVLKVRRQDLDLDYVRHWSAHLDVRDLLDRALEDAGIDE